MKATVAARTLWPAAWPYLVLLAIASALYAPVFAGEIIFYRDPANWNLPARFMIADAFARGDSAGWNPLQGFGFSAWGNPLYGFGYPFNWLFLLVGRDGLARLLTWQSFLHMVGGGVGLLALARRLGASRTGALIGGLAWTLSGYTTAMWNAGLILLADAWLPWCGLGFVALVRRASDPTRSLLPGIAWAALPVGLALLMGEVFIACMSVAFALATAGADWHSRRRSAVSSARVLVACGAALALGGAVGAVTVLPVRASAAHTERGRPLAKAYAETCSIPPLRLAEIAAPRALGDPLGESYPAATWIGEPRLGGMPLAFSLYLGASVLALATLAVRRRDSLTMAFAGLALAALLIAMGRYTPVHGLLRRLVPPLAYMRYPEKYFVLVLGWVSLLAAFGATRLCAAGAPRRRLLGLAAGYLALALTAGLLFPPALRGGGVRASLLGAVLVLVVLALAAPATLRWRGALLAGVVALDLGLVVMSLQEFAPARLAQQEPEAARVVKAAHTGWPAPPRVYRASDADARFGRAWPLGSNAAMQLRSVQTLIVSASVFGIDVLPAYDAAIPEISDRFWLSARAHGQEALRLMGASFAMLPIGPKGEPPGRRAALEPLGDPLPGTRLYRVKEPLPRVYLAGAATTAADGDIEESVFAPEVVGGGRVYLAPEAGAVALAGSAERAGACRLETYRNVTVGATCEATRPAVAVFLEQSALGWRAEVDGQPAPLWRANRVFRAVPVPAGRHTITLRFEAPGVALGRWVSLAAVSLLIAFFAVGVRLGARSTHASAALPLPENVT